MYDAIFVKFSTGLVSGASRVSAKMGLKRITSCRRLDMGRLTNARYIAMLILSRFDHHTWRKVTSRELMLFPACTPDGYVFVIADVPTAPTPKEETT
jgi:hypothetical protein